ncbi:MAG: DUF3987 domain-containing protein [Verrucomicrobiales bacterium]
MSINNTELDVAAYYVHHPTPPGERLPIESFADIRARKTLEIIDTLEAAGKSADKSTFLKGATEADRLPCEAGELAGDVFDSEASTWTPEILDTAEMEIREAAERRNCERSLSQGLAKLKKGEPLEAIRSTVTHHWPTINADFADYDIGANEPPPFPIEVLDGTLAGEMTREIARLAQVPVSLALATVLGVASGAIGAGLRVRTWAGETGANIWFLCVARSGTGKDRALNIAAEPLFSLERDRLEAWNLETKPDLEADLRTVKAELTQLDKNLKDGGDDETRGRVRDLERRRVEINEKLEAEPSLTVGDITKEALAVAMGRQSGEACIAVSSEARGILNIIAGRYSGDGDEDLWLSGFSGTRTKVSRMGRDTLILKQPCLSALLMVQPDSFRRAAARPEMAESGFLPRFLPFDSKAEPQHNGDQIETPGSNLAGRWYNRIKELVTNFRDEGENPAVLGMEPRAMKLLRDYANDLVDRRNDDLRDCDAFAARWAEIACRVALTIHALEHGVGARSRPVSEAAARRAHIIVSWYADAALDLLGDARETKRRERRDRLRDILEGFDNRTATLRDLDRRHGFSREDVEAMLPKIGGRIESKQGGRGRPSLVAVLPKGPMP